MHVRRCCKRGFAATCTSYTKSQDRISSLHIFGIHQAYVVATIAYTNEYDVKKIGSMNPYGIESDPTLMGGNILHTPLPLRRWVEDAKKSLHTVVNLHMREVLEIYQKHHNTQMIVYMWLYLPQGCNNVQGKCRWTSGTLPWSAVALLDSLVALCSRSPW